MVIPAQNPRGLLGKGEM